MARFVKVPPHPAHTLHGGREYPRFINADLVIRVEDAGIFGESYIWMVGERTDVYSPQNRVYMGYVDLVVLLNSPEPK